MMIVATQQFTKTNLHNPQSLNKLINPSEHQFICKFPLFDFLALLEEFLDIFSDLFKLLLKTGANLNSFPSFFMGFFSF